MAGRLCGPEAHQARQMKDLEQENGGLRRAISDLVPQHVENRSFGTWRYWDSFPTARN